jgi:hypothetical protein
MFKIIPVFMFMVIVLILVPTQREVNASFYVTCEYESKVITEPMVVPDNEASGLSAKVKIGILRELGCEGHAEHVYSENSEKEVIVSGLSPEDLRLLIPGAIMILIYDDWNSMTPQGVVGDTTWRLKALPEKPADNHEPQTNPVLKNK